MTTHWFGESWHDWLQPNYEHMRIVAFEAGGCACDVNGVGDGNIQIIGVHRNLNMRQLHENFEDAIN